MKSKWVQDIMSQKFLDSDITRILMLYAFIEVGMIKKVYTRKEILEYIYRTYSDNNNLALNSPYIRIKNINRYGLTDIKFVLDHCLEDWKLYDINNILRYDDGNIYLSFGQEDNVDDISKITLQVTKMLQKKYFGIDFKAPKLPDISICRKDKNLDLFGKSTFRNRVFEDMQYCPLCEELNLDKLYVVHILPQEYCDDYEILDKNNGILLCYDHAVDYLEGKFFFKESGFVHNVNSDIIETYMHLSLNIKNKERRDYIRRYYQIMTNITK